MKIIGMNVKKYIGQKVEGSCSSFSYENSEKIKYDIFVQSKKKKFKVSIWDEEGVCGSGWTTASYGHIEVKEINSYPPMNFRYKNIKEIPIELSEADSGANYLNIPEVFSVSYDGGDEYYPSGGISIEIDNFIPQRGFSSIESIKRKVWIFEGDSGLGKSFLANLLNQGGLTVYETDKYENLPKEISDDIIVIGNKQKFQENEIISVISNLDNTEVIMVNFC